MFPLLRILTISALSSLQRKSAFVDDERAPEGVENMKNRRDGGGASCEHWLVAKRADHEQKAGFAAAVVAPHTEVRELVEAVVEPGEENVVAGDPLELRGEVDVAVDVGLDLGHELGLRAVLLWAGRQQDHVVFDEVVLGRIRHEPLARGKLEAGHDCHKPGFARPRGTCAGLSDHRRALQARRPLGRRAAVGVRAVSLRAGLRSVVLMQDHTRPSCGSSTGWHRRSKGPAWLDVTY